jgi:hypothetical protein
MPSELKGQTDFSAGEIDPAAKRDNKNPLVLAGVRQGANFRILNTKGMQNRSGRRALFRASVRTEEFLIAPGVTYYLNFGNGTIDILNSSGTSVFAEVRPWSAATAKNVVWAIYDKSIYVTFAGMVPRIYTWDGATTWTAADFAEQVIGSQKRTLFYRLAPKGITMSVAGTAGPVNITFSANVLVAGMVGTRIRFNGKQMTINSVTNGVLGNATFNEGFASNRQTLTFAAFSYTPTVGDVLSGGPSGASGQVISVAAPSCVVELTSSARFIVPDKVFDGGNFVGITTAVADAAPAASVIWDQEVMNTYQGWPASVFVDQNRLGFCNFPSVPGGIAWSAVINFSDFYPDAFATDGLATDAIFEIAPNKSQVLYVVPGLDASEFVFCDNRLYYIQITPANPLRPGSVGFNAISEDECGQVQPRRAGEFILYTTGGLNQLKAVRVFGAYTRAYKVDDLTELHAHLFTSITAIAIMTASASFAERYAFILNADGSVICGKYSLDKNGELEGTIGWTPWTGNGTVKWVSCKGSNILFTTSYAPGGIAAVQIAELLDDSRYLDGSQLYNTQPAGLPIPGGKGPLWWLAGGTVDLMDGPLGTRMMGTYVIDANGFLVPQNNGGEDFTSVNLVVGQAWTATLEPFCPPSPAGDDKEQRMKKRRIKRAQVNVANSSGFVMQRLYSGQSGPQLPANGTVMSIRRITTWNQGEDPTQPPPLREQSYSDRPLGRSHDPRWALSKDTPGPLTVLEITLEPTV